MSTVIKHGTTYFLNKGIKCPECDFSIFRICDFIDTRYLDSAPTQGVYILICSNCNCEWQEVVNE